MTDIEELRREQEANKATESHRLLGTGRYKDDEDGMDLLAGKDVDDRLGFIRKVYALLSCMITFTFGCIAMTKAVDDLNDWVR